MNAQPAPLPHSPPAFSNAAVRSADADITAAVELLLMKKGICTNLLKVKCRDGIVELVGVTDNLLSREHAVSMAESVHGVRGIINKISIRTLNVPDSELQQRAKQALLQNPVTSSYVVHCRSRNGVLTVAGALPSEAARQAVLRVLKGIAGVCQINNRLRVQETEATSSDDEIITRFYELLAGAHRGKRPLIYCRTTHGVAHLIGTVNTPTERDHLVAIAYLAGAAQVDSSKVMVAYWAVDWEIRRQRIMA